uniref:F-box domain-containing protein n=1 Tax=Caenorhabditis tropicalis TaxID=1561998 RepID=A0A1I7TIR8_9PELO
MNFLQFPYLVQIEILQHFQLYEFFFLGMCSKRAKILVQRLGPKYDKAVIDCLFSCIGVQTTGIVRPLSDDVDQVVMYSAENKPENVHLRNKKPFWKKRIELNFRKKRIRCRISSHPVKRIPILWCKREYIKLLPMALHYHICDIFNLSTDIQIKFRVSDISEFPDTNVVDNLKAHGVIWNEDDVSRTLFENIRIKNSLWLSTKLLFEPEHHIFSANHIYSYSSKWVTVDHLMKFQGRSVWFMDAVSIGTEELVTFINDWLNGSNTKLEVMFVGSGSSEHPKFDKEKTMKSFDFFPWNPEKRGGRFKFALINETDTSDCTREMDIERESDGTLATIMIEDFYFRFYVWHERFPDPSTTQPEFYEQNSMTFFTIGNITF